MVKIKLQDVHSTHPSLHKDLGDDLQYLNNFGGTFVQKLHKDHLSTLNMSVPYYCIKC